MATTTANILVGAATVALGPYVTAGGAGSLVDVGHTKTPTTLTATFEDFEIISERAPGVLSKVNTMTRYAIKVAAIEASMQHYLDALREPLGNLSGTPPDTILLVGGAGPAEKYHQITLVGKGLGTTGVRTITFWRAVIESVSEIPFAKGAEQLLEMNFSVLWDGSVSTNDKFLKIVET